MRFRPANISLINRRHYLPRLLLTLSSIGKDYDHRILTGHYISLTVRPRSSRMLRFGWPAPVLGLFGSSCEEPLAARVAAVKPSGS
jgi:hypothetical protein